ncbi:gp89 [Erwinia phage vB_EamM-Y2]|uniref:Gp89 n=1 Tax=Erwinia phage vB_EamM-Y2 TaxID=1051676 RepID=G0YQ38_9CAUD|nr:gp89 [Erwinia phage vB_EamM-Y2]AEJ81465.1 gp89 [Erwinia phage vB_EamM-Y2]
MDFLEKLVLIWTIVWCTIFVVNCCSPRKSPTEKLCNNLVRLLNALFVFAVAAWVYWVR